MRLSVVTASFGSGRFLAETPDSVAALRTAHEQLVMDGGSDDGTVEPLQGRDDPGLVWVSEADCGQTHAVYMGLERATGDRSDSCGRATAATARSCGASTRLNRPCCPRISGWPEPYAKLRSRGAE